MSAYANDPRVTDMGDGFFRVLPRPGEQPLLAVAPGVHGGFVAGQLGEEWSGLGFDTADEAIRSLIGDPQS